MGVGNKRRQPKEDILANPKRHHPSAAEKLRVLQYADEYGVRPAQRKFPKISKSAGSILGWEKQKDALQKKAHAHGGHVKTLHPGKKSQFHATEGKFRRRLLQRYRHHIAVTKKMMMRWATCMDARQKAMSDGQRANWWCFPTVRYLQNSAQRTPCPTNKGPRGFGPLGSRDRGRG